MSELEDQLQETRDLASNAQRKADILEGLICQWIGLEKEAVASEVSGPSQWVPDSGPKVAHDTSQMNQANGYGGSLLKPQTDARGFEAPQGFIFYQETAPPGYDPVSTPTSAAGQTALLHSPDYTIGTNSDIAQARTDTNGPTAPGGSFQQACPQENDSSDMPQAAGTSAGHQQSPTADALLSTWFDFDFGSAPSAPHAATRTEPSSHLADTVSFAATPALPHSPDNDVGANPGIPRAQTHADGQTAPGGPFQQAWLQENDSTNMPQAAGTSSGHQQSLIAEALFSPRLGSYFGLAPSAPQASTRPKPSNHASPSVSSVAPKPNPNTFNHGTQPWYKRY